MGDEKLNETDLIYYNLDSSQWDIKLIKVVRPSIPIQYNKKKEIMEPEFNLYHINRKNSRRLQIYDSLGVLIIRN